MLNGINIYGGNRGCGLIFEFHLGLLMGGQYSMVRGDSISLRGMVTAERRQDGKLHKRLKYGGTVWGV